MNSSKSESTRGIPRKIMFIAGEASGDNHAAHLIEGIRAKDPGVHCFGAGGPKMAAAGMELILDLTEHAVLGLVEVLRNYFKFRRFFYQMLRVVEERKPDVVVLVDYPGFNLRFAKALRRRFGDSPDRPKVVYYIAPQVWAWAEGRVKLIARCVDLLVSIFPFEKAWFAQRAPGLRVEFVGHPIMDGHASLPKQSPPSTDRPILVLLPGSRRREVRLHWPILKKAAELIAARMPVSVTVVATTDAIEAMIRENGIGDFQISRDMTGMLSRATVAIAASGTATLECAYFGVPTVVIYKVAWPTYVAGRMLIKVKYLAMPNLLAQQAVFPEFIQRRARAEWIAEEAVNLISDHSRRRAIKETLARAIATLGSAGATTRAVDLIIAGS
ncbi:MAG: lipid-A-disaccharide synthase [Verrucomicrobiae bacterium]|nr:lipid-A-disaccharide synthase [Verrucomicrobiae bacterium]